MHTHLFTTEKFFYQPIGPHPHQILDPLRDKLNSTGLNTNSQQVPTFTAASFFVS